MKVELRHIYKRFGSVQANRDVSLSIESGAIHGVLGENGAGKSTLMKVLSGLLSADSGEVLLDGCVVRLRSPSEAVAAGVGMLHQDPLDFPSLPVLDSVLLGCRRVAPSRKRAVRELERLATQFDFRLDPFASVSSLSLGERQQLELLRLLWLGVRTLILDEPTSAISPLQRDKLFMALRKIAAEGRTVILVSHKLAEVQELCSSMTVLAKGRVAGHCSAPCETDRLIRLMFGESISRTTRTWTPPGDPVLELDGVTVSDGRMTLRHFSLQARAGEVIGLAGLEGSGQRLALQVCAGLRRPLSGQIRLRGEDVTGRPYRCFLDRGVAYAPAGRLEEALLPGMTLAEHVALAEPAPTLLVDWRAALERTHRRLHEYDILGTPVTRVEELSGGNQQRTVLALLPSQAPLLLMEHPVRGLDLGSCECVWRLLEGRTRQGAAVVFATSDLDELFDRSDRILVFFAGRVSPPLDSRHATPQLIGELMGGKGFE